MTAAHICGPDGCEAVRGERTLQLLAQGGEPTDAPGARRPFSVVRIVVDTGQPRPIRLANLVLPSRGLVQGEHGTWMRASPAAQRALRRLTADRTPYPASGMPAGRRLEPGQAAIVEVHRSPAAPGAGDTVP